MKKGLKEMEREVREASQEFDEKVTLLHLSYDVLANGGRGLRERIARKKVDPETAEAIRRMWA